LARRQNSCARVDGYDEADEAAAREKLGEKIAERIEGVWLVRSLGAPSIADRTEAELIRSFVDRIAEYRPQGG